MNFCKRPEYGIRNSCRKIHWFSSKADRSNRSKTNPLVVLFDDPEQDKFVFWPIKNLSEAENIFKQIRLENDAAKDFDRLPDVFFIDDFGPQLCKNRWLGERLGDCRNEDTEHAYCYFIAQTVDSQMGIPYWMVPNIDAWFFFQSCKGQAHLIITKLGLACGEWSQGSKSGRLA